MSGIRRRVVGNTLAGVATAAAMFASATNASAAAWEFVNVYAYQYACEAVGQIDMQKYGWLNYNCIYEQHEPGWAPGWSLYGFVD